VRPGGSLDPRTASALNELNRDFYDRHAESFGASRDAPWPGWERVVAGLLDRLSPDPADGAGGPPPPVRVLDVGCGNARFATTLDALLGPLGRTFSYTGVDACRALLDQARLRIPAHVASRFSRADLVAQSLDTALPRGPFELVCAFGLLHHVPGRRRRGELIRAFGDRLAPRGVVAVTAWRFERFDRFQRHRIPWEAYNDEACRPIPVDDLEPGDHLLRWGDGSGPPRYCHFADAAETAEWAETAGLVPFDRFQADGREGALNEYLLLTDAG